MTIQLLGSLAAAFLVSKIFGKWLIPWLEKHDIRQITKDEVEQTIYSGKNNSTTASE